MTEISDGIVTRDHVEAAVWRFASQPATRRSVDMVMRLIDQYATELAGAPETKPTSLDDLRQCTGCGSIRPLREFRRDSRSAEGRRARCRECENGQARGRYAKRRADAREMGQ